MTMSERGKIMQGPRSLQEIELAIRSSEEARRPATGRAWEEPIGATEVRLAAIWCEVIGLNRVGRGDHFFEIGGHSLAAVSLLGRIRDELGMELTLLDVLEAPVLQQFALRVDASPASSRSAKSRGGGRRIPRAPVAEHYPTTPGQRQVWLHQQAFPASAAYHITGSFVASGEFRTEGGLLEQAALTIMQRHASLRTIFRQHHGVPVQCVLESMQPVIRYGHAPSQAVGETIRSFVREPFDLERGPLVRLLHLECTDTGVRTITWAVHHIVCDGVSLRNISREFLRLLLNPQVQLPPPPEVSFVDYACWQEDAEELRTAGDWWQAMLQDLPPRLQLPMDRVADTNTGAYCVEIPAELGARVQRLCLESGATPFMVYLCALSALLGRVCSQQDFLVGLLTAGRNRATTQNIVGYFSNVGLFRARLDSAKGFADLLGATRSQVVDILRNQEYPFSRMLEDANAAADPMEFPLTPVLFNLLPENASAVAFADRRLGHWIHNEESRSEFEMCLYRRGDDTSLAVYYPRRLFLPETIESIIDAYVTLLGQGLASPERALSELELLSPASQRQLLEWNDTAAVYPRERGIHQLFEQQAHGTPEAVAVVFEDETLTYRQLNARANQLARHLRGEGVGPEVLVGLYVERTPEMVVGLLAILKTGGAYVPLDPTYPRERIAFMLGDAAPKLVLTQERLLEQLQFDGQMLCLDRDWSRIATQDAHDLDNLTQPDQLAYVIYTSGSTGQPKGVQIPIGALANFLASMSRTPGIEASDTLLAITSLSFDIAGLEIFLPLTQGARIVLASREQAMQGSAIQSLCLRHGVTFMQATPSTWRMLKEQAPNLRLRMALCGGEALDPSLAQHLCAIAEEAWNVYGPTETTIWSTADRLVSGQPFGLGRPIANTQIHILDAQGRPVPMGVAGELHISGAGLARGYLNRPELTAQKFIGAADRRLYKTGDLARWRADGNLEYLGRMDHQVKLRGVRIELGEIESVLQQQEGVRQAVAMVREDVPGEKRLVAYVVVKENDAALVRRRVQAQTDSWREVWDSTYKADEGEQHCATFNLTGWTSSYDKQPFAAQQMREWVYATVRRILEQQPRDVLEIGCGTGLLLHRVAPFTRSYHGIDLSEVVLGQLRASLREAPVASCRVTLDQGAAHDLSAIEGEFDTVVVNSVVQYFPSLDYLTQVLEGAIGVVGDNGSIFVGDVRNQRRAAMFNHSVALHEAAPAVPLTQVRQAALDRQARETELLVDPDYFRTLRTRFSRIASVEVLPKLGEADNELTRYRYDVVIRLGQPPGVTVQPRWLPWEGLERLQQHLRHEQPACLGLCHVPDAQVARDARAHDVLAAANDGTTVAQLRDELAVMPPVGVSAGELASLCAAHGLRLQLSLAGAGDRAFHAVLSRDEVEVDWQGAEERGTGGAMANTPAAPHLDSLVRDALRQRLTQHLPEAMVPGTFVLLRELPLTPNGKVDRKALPAPDGHQQSARAYVAPHTPTEQALARIWATVLRVDKVGLHDNFFELGGHSLLATRVVSLISQDLGRELPLRSLFEHPELAALASRLDDASEQAQAIVPIRPVPRDGDLPLSYAQQRLWFLDQYGEGHAAYNIPATLRLVGPVEAALVQQSFDALITRHESLRTVFGQSGGQPVQIVKAPSAVQVRFSDLSGLAQEDRASRAREQIEAEARQPFDLARGPLLRVSLLKLGEQDHLLQLTIHHIVSDGWSMGVLVQEVARIYEAVRAGREAQWTAPAIQYADYAAWQRERLQGEYLGRQLAYWKAHLHGATPLLGLPTDRPRPPVQRHHGASLEFSVQRQTTAKLHDLARQQGATLFMVLQAAFAVLLHRYSGQDDISVGTPIAGRNRVELEGLIGFFVNTLVLRTRLDGQESFVQLLQRAKKVALEAYAHQEVPFEQLVEELKPQRSLSYEPLFQVMFILQNAPRQKLEIPGLGIELLGGHSGTAKFDLTCSVTEAGDRLVGSLEYNTDLFDEATIRRMAKHYEVLLEGICQDASVKVGQLALLTGQEERQILVEWNATHGEYLRHLAIHQLFEEQVQRAPDAVAVVYEGEELTYEQLNARANQLARHLRGLGVGPEVLVGICVERSLEMVVGLLGILKAGGAYVPLDPSYPSERLAYMLGDAKPMVLLTQERLLGQFPAYEGSVLCLDRDCPQWAEQDRADLDSLSQPEHLAYVIYTSGSTGQPKGVGVCQQGVFNFLQSMAREPGLSLEDTALGLTSLSFDIAALELYLPLMQGARIVLATAVQAQEPQSLCQLLDEQRVNVVQATPSSWHMLIDQGWSPAWPVKALCGGEALPAGLMRSMVARFGAVWNMYGPTESTIWSSLACLDGTAEPTIGRPIANTQIYILDGQFRPVPVGVAGELHIGGAGLARGYLNKPELTVQRFIGNPFGEAGSRLYKTGDLARYLPDGNIEYLGRMDNQVKLRGFRIELGEIESVLQQHEQVGQAVVVVREDEPGDKRLVAYVVGKGEQQADVVQLREHLKVKVPEYMIPGVIVQLEQLPLTPNGKVDRKALPAPEGQRQTGKEYVEPRTATERKLAQIWAQVLKVERVGVHDNFFELGGHSLLATRVVSLVSEALGREVALRVLFEHAELELLARHLEGDDGAPELVPMAVVARDGRLPLSYAQQRLWFLDQYEKGQANYNIPLAVKLSGSGVSVEAIGAVFKELVNRHETLRTVFGMQEGEPRQVIHEQLEVHVGFEDLQGQPDVQEPVRERIVREARKPFDLEAGPLLRVSLLRLGVEENVLLLTVHHIISDGWSMGVLINDVAQIYKAQRKGEQVDLPELPIQYADYAVWQRERLQGGYLQEQLGYWKGQLHGAPALLELPLDRPRPAVQTYRGASVGFALSKELTVRLKELSQAQGATLFMVLQAAFAVLLHRYSGQDDISVGTPIAGRERAELEGLIGFFVNTLVLRTRVDAQESFEGLLRQAKETALQAYAHQEVPFEQLVEELKPQRSLSYSPLFQVMFILQNAPRESLEIPGLTFEPMAASSRTAKFDLTCSVTEGGGRLFGGLEYNTDLFDEATIKRLARHYEVLLEGVCADPQAKVGELPLLTPEEERQILVEWNDTAVEYPRDKAIHQLFEEQVQRAPDAVAVVYEGEELTYGQLNARANRLARQLRRRGVGPGVLVGICVGRSLEMVMGLLGVLKAGGAYLPLDPSYPSERLEYMLQDAAPKVLLTQQRLLQELPLYQAQVLCVEGDEALWAEESEADLDNLTQPQHMAYVTYTSGSTGQPKGVVAQHQSVVNYVWFVSTVYAITQVDRVLQIPSLSFDASVRDVLGTLISGAQLHLLTDDAARSPLDIRERMQEGGITALLSITPSLLELVAAAGEDELATLRLLLVSGEALPEALVESVALRMGRQVQVVNQYGPTECTMTSTFHRVQVEGPIHIGRPIPNGRTYILDPQQRPVPVGVAGELYVGGVGVSRGYLNRPELTAQKFVANPFEAPGSRMYRTGDLARYLPDGNIVYLGRLDHQVKLRGVRIELEEIENVLRQQDRVAQAVVAVQSEVPRLVAYVVPADLDVKQLHAALKAKLPEPMLPATYVALDSLPLTANGKIDRRQLPTLDGKRPAQTEYVAPRNAMEDSLVCIWADVLKVERVGVNDNFFELGGHSLLATTLIGRVKEAFDVQVHLQELFHAPTVAHMAECIEQGLSLRNLLRAPVVADDTETLEF